MKVSEIEPIKLGLTDNEMFIFYFRRPFASEHSAAYDKFIETEDLEGEEKSKKEFEIFKENLIHFSSRPPELHRLENDKWSVIAEHENIQMAFDQLFPEYTADAEQIIIDAWLEFQKKRQSRKFS